MDVLGQDVVVGEYTGQLEVTVVDRSVGVGRGDKLVGYGGVEAAAPYQGAAARNEPYTAHTLATRVYRADAGRLIRNDLFDSSGAIVEVVGQRCEVRQLLPDRPSDADAMVCLPLLQGGL